MYKTEGSRMFQELLKRIERDVVHKHQLCLHISLPGPQGPQWRHESKSDEGGGPPAARVLRRLSRPIRSGATTRAPCGSNKKYKRCHGSNG